MVLPVPVAKPTKWVAVAAMAGLCLTACNKTNDGATIKNLAWVANDASVTLPGSAITPVDLTTDHALERRTGRKSPLGLDLHQRQ